MADYTYEALKHKTIADLREIARGIDHEAVKGFSQLNKEHLLPGLCKALGIDTHEHHHVVGGFDKGAAKKKAAGAEGREAVGVRVRGPRAGEGAAAPHAPDQPPDPRARALNARHSMPSSSTSKRSVALPGIVGGRPDAP